MNSGKADNLRSIASDRLDKDVFVYDGDCNEVLTMGILPRVQFKDYRRALCILDPYGLHLDWKVISMAGSLKTVDMFLNFPIMDMNRNVLWNRPDLVAPEQAARMTRFWGDDSWRQTAYRKEANLFDVEELKNSNEDVAEGFRSRLKSKAGFANVIPPLAMKNTTGATVYYLFFASPNAAGNQIANDVFAKFRDRSR